MHVLGLKVEIRGFPEVFKKLNHLTDSIKILVQKVMSVFQIGKRRNPISNLNTPKH
jgi:hypothetical protein